MVLGLDNLLRQYCSAIAEEHAALFIGAGMSRFPEGFVDWKDLIRPYAKQVGLDVDKECDLVAVLQYYLNSKTRERSFLNRGLVDEFDRSINPTTNHEKIAGLGVKTIWTTNYDRLIEDAFRKANKRIDVKWRDKDIGSSRPRSIATLYKMHGDISQPDKVIISKEDYELYAVHHPVFQMALTLDLLSKHFLFLGLSFDDPNLNYTLGHLCALLANKKRSHHAIFRHARREWLRDDDNNPRYDQYGHLYKDDPAAFAYKKNAQLRRVDDLQRYGIESILIDKFDQITEVLQVIAETVNQFRLWVAEEWDQSRIEKNVDKWIAARMILPSERKALRYFFKITVAHFRICQESNLPQEKLFKIVGDTARDLVEDVHKINVEHAGADLPKILGRAFEFSRKHSPK